MFTFGADPEFFIADGRTGEPMPIVGLLGGTKAKPRMVGDYGVQEDNVMAEYTIPPLTSPSDMTAYAHMGRNATLGEVQMRVRNAIWHESCEAFFTLPVLRKAGPQAQQFGCSPDFDAYTQGAMCPPIDRTLLADAGGEWRFAGGHIHVGYKERCGIPPFVAAMFMDYCVGLQLVPFDRQGRRRALYGMAGRFRPTKYGLEYRTPSCMWVGNRAMMQGVSRGLNKLVEILSLPETEILRLYETFPWPEIQQAINTEDHGLAAIIADLDLMGDQEIRRRLG